MIRHKSYCLLALALLTLNTAEAAPPVGAPTLGIPIQCTLGRDCFVQNYADVDPTRDYRDYTCGRLAYDKHKGTDFRLRNLKQMEAGVAVLAAADGTVRGLRDGMEDASIRDVGRDAVKDKECGNGVVLRHAGRWETQYCHMRKGSVRVKQGQAVKKGDALGLIGMSGHTEFPHLHLSVRRGEEAIDPYTGQVIPGLKGEAAESFACRFDPGAAKTGGLWDADALPQVAYRPTALLGAGFAAEPPEATRARKGEYDAAILPAHSPVLGFWVDIMGAQPGDVLSLVLLAPGGGTLAENSKTFEKSLAQQFQFLGKRFQGQPIPAGTYRARALLKRGGAVVLEETREVVVQYLMTPSFPALESQAY